MSRLAHLLSQLAATPQTQDKLAATYFDQPSPPARPPMLPPERPMRRLTGPLVGGVGVGLLIGVLMAGTVLRARGFNLARLPTVYPMFTFDEPDTWKSLGRRFGLWWAVPGDPRQSLALTLDPGIRAGSSGRSLRLDYTLSPRPHGAALQPSLSGVWFELPLASRAIPGQLEIMIRGAADTDHPQAVILELRSRTFAEQHSVTIGPAWTTVRVPLALRVDPSGEAMFWREFRILLEDGPAVQRGHLYLDEIRLTTKRED